jgi:phenylalanyl-tRNA synthetase beta subunit (EC 6.1.1.20)
VRRSSRKLGIKTDSSFRFERHVDPECVDWASRRAAKMIQEIAGGQILEGVIDLNGIKQKETRVTLRTSQLNSLLGIYLEKAK